jgi:2Fe-2S ferredoxin
MARITYVQPDGAAESYEVASGLSVMQGAVEHNVAGIPAECGGAAACATCRVYVAPEWAGLVGARKLLEESMLDDEDPRYAQLRLSCQISVTPELDGLVVEVAYD